MTEARPDNPPGAADPEPVVRVVDLVRDYDGRRVLNGVTFDVYPGQTLVIIGPSGCGKSTLLRHIIGAIPPTSGRVELFGRDLADLSERGLDALRLRFGVLFQSGALFNSLTVAENVALPLREHTRLDRETIDIIVKMKLELVNLRDAADRRPAEISGGMKKRAALARAIALDPELLFYDEPSAGLDPVTAAEIDQLVVDLTGKLGATSVVVTHEMHSAFTIADRMIMLDAGKVLKAGPREEFEALRDAGPAADLTAATIRQFLRGESIGPLTDRRLSSGYEQDILNVAVRRS